MGRQLHPSRQQGNTVQKLSLIRQDVEKNYNRPNDRAIPSGRGPYYENCVQKKCNRPDARPTPSGRGLDMVLCGAHYEKLVAQLSIWMASACVRTPPTKNQISVD
jgi:hypothetical protein